MRSNKEAKKILKAFGKEAYKERIKYVDSFIPEKTSFIKSISYRHTFRRVAMVTLMVVLIMALAVSAYAAIIHYLNYTKFEHNDNDEYVSESMFNGRYNKTDFLIPTYIPSGYGLINEYYDEQGNQRTYEYKGEGSDSLLIIQSMNRSSFHVDNERAESKTVLISNMEVIIYDFSDEIVAVMQYKNNRITIEGKLNENELGKIILGMNIPD